MIQGVQNYPDKSRWWQTETGGILIAPQPGAMDLKPGSATKPFYGIKPAIVNQDGKVIKGEGKGRLCITQSWPGQMRTVFGDHQRFIDTYFSQFDGKYFTGDGCKRDKDGKGLKGEAQGRLCISQSWPGQMRSVYGDHQTFKDT